MTADQLAFNLGDGITVYAVAADGVPVDRFEDVDLGDPLKAFRNGRTSLKEACLWGCVAIERYERDQEGRRIDRPERRSPPSAGGSPPQVGTASPCSGSAKPPADGGGQDEGGKDG